MQYWGIYISVGISFNILGYGQYVECTIIQYCIYNIQYCILDIEDMHRLFKPGKGGTLVVSTHTCYIY